MLQFFKKTTQKAVPTVLTEKLFAAPGHFYSPIPSDEDTAYAADRAAQALATDWAPGGIKLDDARMLSLWEAFAPTMASMPFEDAATDENYSYRYHYVNGMYPYGDACVFFGMVTHFRPQKIVEIGSGFSSALALDMREILGRDIDLTFIEPYPERLQKLLRGNDRDRAHIIKSKVQDVDLQVFKDLNAGDILFIDSSHVAKAGSDVCFEIFDILPLLKSGVLVHIHDCFWPFEYSRQWLTVHKRSWNELYFIRAFLMYNSAFEVLFFNNYFAKKFRALAAERDPKFAQASGGGLWLIRT